MEQTAHSTRRDMAAGTTLFVLAVVWTVIVYFTVPTGSGVGPRAFPLVLGLILMGFSAVLVAVNLYNWRRGAEGRPEAHEDADGPGSEVARTASLLRMRVLVTVCVAIAIYGYLMQKLGFVVATFLTVVALLLTLKERRFRVVLGMGLGITLGCWLVFGQLLGAYIPRGTWISLF
ncbi:MULTISPECIES: tripartite tricarboxylate transporter TctB family protein [unclassified Hoeflea]|uniref:tripartite tricarboxylate transporter TctB family protein n=1 Tax=unclassified Hoeflea TaxID=2614931 RepID=UPI002AFE11C5|nr:tripartite tricarboxylate transporter TctB family protein [Hoeflea sp.]